MHPLWALPSAAQQLVGRLERRMPAQPRNVFTSPCAGRKPSKAPAGFLPRQASRPLHLLPASSAGQPHCSRQPLLPATFGGCPVSLHKPHPVRTARGLGRGPALPQLCVYPCGTLTNPLPSLTSVSLSIMQGWDEVSSEGPFSPGSQESVTSSRKARRSHGFEHGCHSFTNVSAPACAGL